MKLGLIGTGKQGQRYLLEKNGGRHFHGAMGGRLSADEYKLLFERNGYAGVVIATHPSVHKLQCIAAFEVGVPVLCEKPLALTLADCMEILAAREKHGGVLNVAHLDRWAWLGLPNYPDPDAHAVVTYAEHKRNYSPWLDWAPHGLAVLDKLGACVARNLSVYQSGENSLVVRSSATGGIHYRREPLSDGVATPMFLAVRDIIRNGDYASLERIYRALFSER